MSFPYLEGEGWKLWSENVETLSTISIKNHGGDPLPLMKLWYHHDKCKIFKSILERRVERSLLPPRSITSGPRKDGKTTVVNRGTSHSVELLTPSSKSSCSITLVKSRKATSQSWIATPPVLNAKSRKNPDVYSLFGEASNSAAAIFSTRMFFFCNGNSLFFFFFWEFLVNFDGHGNFYFILTTFY